MFDTRVALVVLDDVSVIVFVLHTNALGVGGGRGRAFGRSAVLV